MGIGLRGRPRAQRDVAESSVHEVDRKRRRASRGPPLVQIVCALTRTSREGVRLGHWSTGPGSTKHWLAQSLCAMAAVVVYQHPFDDDRLGRRPGDRAEGDANRCLRGLVVNYLWLANRGSSSIAPCEYCKVTPVPRASGSREGRSPMQLIRTCVRRTLSTRSPRRSRSQPDRSPRLYARQPVQPCGPNLGEGAGSGQVA